MDHPFAFRPGTCDADIFRKINGEENEYRLPGSFERDDIVLDIGAHIGSFSHAAVRRGARHVHAFEAFVENYECAVRNLAGLSPAVAVRNMAVWRSDRKLDTLRFTELDPVNKGAGHVLGSAGGPEVEVIAFDEIVRQVTANGRKRVKMVKMDCEGSEFPILLTSRTLHLIDCIVGEYHNFTREHGPEHPFHRISDVARVEGYERYTITELSGALRLAGFDVEVQYHETHPTLSGWFFAHRDGRPALWPSRWRWHRDGLKYKLARLSGSGRRPHPVAINPGRPSPSRPRPGR